MSDKSYSVRAVLRVLDILDLLQQAPDGVLLPEIAGATGLPKSSAFRYLATLEGRGYVERDSTNGSYHLGMAFLPSYATHLDMLAGRARPVLEEVRDRFGETVNLGVLDGNRVAYLEIVESRRGMRFAARRGDREPMHSTALGKAIASLLEEERVRSILTAEGMPQRTAHTITDPDRFLKEIDQVRRRGYALDDRENEEDGKCVAVPVTGIRLPAAVSLSAPATRLSEPVVAKAARALRDAAGRIRRALGGEG